MKNGMWITNGVKKKKQQKLKKKQQKLKTKGVQVHVLQEAKKQYTGVHFQKLKMASKKDTYEKEILEIIIKFKLFIIKDIFAYYTKLKSAQFYNLGLEKSECILKAIDDNKVKTCHSQKKKWFESENPTLQIALYKLNCSEGEREKISINYNKNDNTNINSTELTSKEIIEINKALESEF